MKLLGACVSLEDLRQELENGDFEQRLQGLESEHEQVSSRLASLHERRGELSEQLKAMAQDRAAAAGRLASTETRQRMHDHVRQWQILAGISLALDSVRQAYETDRQPETLAEASSYLKRLTSDRYQRIWTPFGESALCVDDQQKKVRRVEELSRGTREQVYLSLRMALASAYARRGAGLPLILDDVFVNFDAHRSHAAAETVCDFAAAGHQVLVFTCHDHIRDVFASLDVDVRCLPPPEEVAEAGQPVLREERIRVTAPVEPTPEEIDPELDLELLYGAPEYDPGYGVPDPEPVPQIPVDRSPPQADPREPEPTDLSQEAYLAGYRDALRESSTDRREVVLPPEPAPRSLLSRGRHWSSTITVPLPRLLPRSRRSRSSRFLARLGVGDAILIAEVTKNVGRSAPPICLALPPRSLHRQIDSPPARMVLRILCPAERDVPARIEPRTTVNHETTGPDSVCHPGRARPGSDPSFRLGLARVRAAGCHAISRRDDGQDDAAQAGGFR